MKKKSLALVLALAMIVVCVVGGTLAWLTDKTAPVTNTFTYGDINITLAESEDLDLKMVPGYTIDKDPKVTVKAGSEKCYLFVKVEKSTNFDTFMTYTMAAGWMQLKDASGNDVDGVYYRVVDTDGMGTAYSVLGAGSETYSNVVYTWNDDQVLVKPTVTKDMLNALNAEGATQPTLTFTAYACQYMKNGTENFTAAEAWAEVNPTTP